MKSITRLIAIAVVILLSSQAGRADDLPVPALPPGPGVTRVDDAIAVTNGFAFDLYAQLARQEPGRNLFFSPYSISTVLTMVAEGARGETADQMGKALHFPQAARNTGPDAQSRPWDLAAIHAGMQALDRRLSSADTPARKEIRAKIEALTRKLEAANERTMSGEDPGPSSDLHPISPVDRWESSSKAQELADQINSLIPQVDQYELRMANSLWGEKTCPFVQSYVETINKFYGTGNVSPVDFINANKRDEARKRINDWVQQHTGNRIRDIISQKALNNLTRLVLANAIYFRGRWEKEFSPGRTANGDFHLQADKTVTVPLMTMESAAGYAAFKDDGTPFETPMMIPRVDVADTSKYYPGPKGLQMLELMYKGGDLSMVVLLPQSPDGMEAIQKLLVLSNVDAWISRLQKRSVEIFLPKFNLETGYGLQEPLQAMGMVRAFEITTPVGTGAQFDGMCQSQDIRYKLYVSLAVHMACVEVNEKGTEAVAATRFHTAGGADRSRPKDEVPFTPVFRADKPFIFLIRDTKTGVVLFLGRVLNPKA